MHAAGVEHIAGLSLSVVAQAQKQQGVQVESTVMCLCPFHDQSLSKTGGGAFKPGLSLHCPHLAEVNVQGGASARRLDVVAQATKIQKRFKLKATVIVFTIKV